MSDNVNIQNQLNQLTSQSNSFQILKNIKLKMAGNTFHLHYHVLYDLINQMPKKNINYVEIGVFNGGSLCLVLQHSKVKNAIGIDPFIFPNQEKNVNENIKTFNYHLTKTFIVKKFSTDLTVLRDLTEFINDIDVLFIDGDHAYNSVI